MLACYESLFDFSRPSTIVNFALLHFTFKKTSKKFEAIRNEFAEKWRALLETGGAGGGLSLSDPEQLHQTPRGTGGDRRRHVEDSSDNDDCQYGDGDDDSMTNSQVYKKKSMGLKPFC